MGSQGNQEIIGAHIHNGRRKIKKTDHQEIEVKVTDDSLTVTSHKMVIGGKDIIAVVLIKVEKALR